MWSITKGCLASCSVIPTAKLGCSVAVWKHKTLPRTAVEGAMLLHDIERPVHLRRRSGSLTKVLIELLDVTAAVTLTTKNKFGSFGGVQMKYLHRQQL